MIGSCAERLTAAERVVGREPIGAAPHMTTRQPSEKGGSFHQLVVVGGMVITMVYRPGQGLISRVTSSRGSIRRAGR
jgi:hypothetical protein